MIMSGKVIISLGLIGSYTVTKVAKILSNAAVEYKHYDKIYDLIPSGSEPTAKMNISALNTAEVVGEMLVTSGNILTEMVRKAADEDHDEIIIDDSKDNVSSVTVDESDKKIILPTDEIPGN